MELNASSSRMHNGTDCNAYVANAGNLTSDGSRLFWTERSLSSRSWKLYSMNTDGTDRRAEAELDYSKAEYAGDAGTAGLFGNKLRLLFKTVRECTDIKTLTPELVNSLIRRIEVHAPKKINGKKHVAVDIYFTGVGLFTIPNEDELEALISELAEKTA